MGATVDERFRLGYGPVSKRGHTAKGGHFREDAHVLGDKVSLRGAAAVDGQRHVVRVGAATHSHQIERIAACCTYCYGDLLSI